MADIFISYAEEDALVAETLARNLDREGYEVWWARHLVAKSDLNTIIRQEIDLAKAVVVIWSRHSVKSRWVEGEAILGEAKGSLICTTAGDDFQILSIPAQFLSMPSIAVSATAKIIAAAEAKGAKKRRHIDERLRAFLQDAATKDLFVNEFAYKSATESDWDAPEHFSQFAVRVALREKGFPTELEGENFTEGYGDTGLDGIAIAWGDNPVEHGEDITKLIEQSPKGPLRLLFVQAKLGDFVHEKDLGHFGLAVQRFVQLSPEEFEKFKPNQLVASQKSRLQDVLGALGNRQIKPDVDIAMVFIYAGPWRDQNRPETTRHQVQDNLRTIFSNARINFDIWGADQVVTACERALPSTEVVLQNVRVLQAPVSNAEVYIGVVGARELVASLSQGSKDRAKLNSQFFVLNPRSFMKIDAQTNPGAYGLQEALEQKLGEEVVVGHNGVAVLAQRAEFPGDNSVRLIAPQVINGAQSANTLKRNQLLLDDAYVPIKIIVSSDPKLIERAIRAANTQAPILEYDMLARLAGMISLQKPFETGAPAAHDRLWLMRRRGEILVNFRQEWERVLTPRQLLEAFVAIVDGPMRATYGKQLTSDAFSGRIFNGAHEPAFYRMLGWLVACGRSCSRAAFGKRWDDVYYGGGSVFAGRHQFCAALFKALDDKGSIDEQIDLRPQRDVQDRFQDMITTLSRAYLDFRATGSSPLLTHVSDVLVSVAGGAGKITAERVASPEYTKSVEDRIRSSRGQLLRPQSGA